MKRLYIFIFLCALASLSTLKGAVPEFSSVRFLQVLKDTVVCVNQTNYRLVRDAVIPCSQKGYDCCGFINIADSCLDFYKANTTENIRDKTSNGNVIFALNKDSVIIVCGYSADSKWARIFTPDTTAWIWAKSIKQCSDRISTLNNIDSIFKPCDSISALPGNSFSCLCKRHIVFNTDSTEKVRENDTLFLTFDSTLDGKTNVALCVKDTQLTMNMNKCGEKYVVFDSLGLTCDSLSKTHLTLLCGDALLFVPYSEEVSCHTLREPKIFFLTKGHITGILFALILLCVYIVLLVMGKRTVPEPVKKPSEQENQTSQDAPQNFSDQDKNKGKESSDANESDIKKLEDEIKGLNENIEILNNAIKQLETEKKQIEDNSKEQAQNLLDKEKKEWEKEQEKQRKKHQKEIENKENEIQRLNQQLQEKEAKVKTIKKEVEERKQKEIDSLSGELEETSGKLKTTQKQLNETQKTLQTTENQLTEARNSIDTLNKAQQEYTEKIVFAPYAQSYAAIVKKLFGIARIIEDTVKTLSKKSLDDPYHLYKAVALFKIRLADIDMEKFETEVEMAAEKQMTFAGNGIAALASLKGEEQKQLVRLHFTNNYLVKYINALQIFTESVIGLQDWMDEISAHDISEIVRLRDQLSDLYNQLNVRVICPKLFEPVGNNMDLRIEQVDAGFTPGIILEIVKCVVYSLDGQKPTDKIYVKAQK